MDSCKIIQLCGLIKFVKTWAAYCRSVEWMFILKACMLYTRKSASLNLELRIEGISWVAAPVDSNMVLIVCLRFAIFWYEETLQSANRG